MKNTVVLSGRLPVFEGRYTAANGDKKSRMHWAMNVQLSTKNEMGYYDETLVNLTAWGYYADQLQQISSMAKDDPTRKEFSNITVTGKMIPGYKDKEGNIVNNLNIDIAEFEFTRRLPSAASVGDQAFAPSTTQTPRTGAPAGAPGRPAPGAGAGRPAAPGMGAPGMGAPAGVPGRTPGVGTPRF